MFDRVTARATGVGAALAGSVLALLLVAAPADAAPEAVRGAPATTATSTEATAARLLEHRVHQREQALIALFDAADRHAQVEEVRVERLAALGYTGEVTDLAYVLPVHGYDLSAGFGQAGPLWESVHTGLDFGAPAGTDLVAAADGTVTEVAYAGAYGLRTILTLKDGTDLWYCHQLASLVVEGQSVEIGEPLGLVGSTGNSTGPHLHLEVRPGGAGPVDPATWLRSVGLEP